MRLLEDRARELFHQFDTNDDGIIDLDELKEMSKALELDKDEELRKRMEQEFFVMDEDNSGGVDFPEFVAYYNKMQAYQSGKIRVQSDGAMSTDFWGDGDGVEAYERLMGKLLKRKKVNQEQHDMVMFMLHSQFLVLDIKIALASYKRAETLLPLRRLLTKVGDEVTRRMSLNDKFWSMTPSEIKRCGTKADQLCSAGVITYDEKNRVHLLLDNRFCMTELKAAFEAIFTNGSASLLKHTLQSSYTLAMQEQEAMEQRSMTQLLRKESTVERHHREVRGSAALPTISSSWAADSVGISDTRFDISHKDVKDRHGHTVALPVLSHKRHSKAQYLSLCKAADLFYSDDASNVVEFDMDVLQKLLHVIDMLAKHQFIADDLAKKAKEFVLKGDKYIVYALYKYDTSFDALEAYLRYKMTDDERIERDVKKARRHIQRRKR